MDAHKIISIDPSLRSVGVYVGDKFYTIATPAEKGINNTDKALENILFDIRAVVVGHKPEICFLEDYSYGSGGNAITSIAEVKGIIKNVMFDYGIPIVLVNIGIWKAVTGFRMPKKGKAWKKNYLEQAKVHAGNRFSFNTPDEVDAFMIYKAVEILLSREPRTEAQCRLINEVKRWM